MYPGIAYWVIGDDTLDETALFRMMQDNQLGATMKLLIQPYQQSKEDLCTALYSTVKDNYDGCVRRMIDSALATMGQPAGSYSIVKLWSRDLAQLVQVREMLSAVKFYIEVESY